MKAAILYNKFFDHNGEHQVIGGVETYLLNLARLCQELNFETTIYQFSNKPFEKYLGDLKIKGIPVFQLHLRKGMPRSFGQLKRNWTTARIF